MRLLRILLIFSMILSGAHIYASDRIFCDFSQGIPSDFVLVDNDGNEPASSVAKLGFAVGKAWIPYCDVDDDNNYVVCSTSWYKSPGTSDDWMILPVLHVKGGTVLSWKSKAVDAKYRDGYVVYLSENGTSLSDFDKTKPLFSVAEEQSVWTTHTVDLSAYQGKDVHIAFVNNSNNKSKLFVDDIFVGVQKTLSVSSNIQFVVPSKKKFVVSGTVYTEKEASISGFQVFYSLGNMSNSLTFPNVTLQKGTPYSFSFSDSISLDEGSIDTLQIWATHGEVTDSVVQIIRALPHYIVAEEYTGTWCPWCVRGIVAMQKMNLTKDDFIGIAVHSLHDPMTISEYESGRADISSVSLYGYPDVIFNRCKPLEGNPLQIENYYQGATKSPMTAGLSVKVSLDRLSKKISVFTSTYFNQIYSNNDIRLAYLLKEDSVHHPNNSQYNQQNAYSGETTPMGGFENLPSLIPSSDMYYMDVARCIKDDVFGVAKSFPDTVYEGKEYTNEYSFLIPDNVDNISKTTLVVLLIDKSNGQILNANQVHLSDLYTTGISDLQHSDNYTVSKSSSSVRILSDKEIHRVVVYDDSGRVVYMAKPMGNNCDVIMTNKGLYVMKLYIGEKQYIKKLYF